MIILTSPDIIVVHIKECLRLRDSFLPGVTSLFLIMCHTSAHVTSILHFIPGTHGIWPFLRLHLARSKSEIGILLVVGGQRRLRPSVTSATRQCSSAATRLR